MMHVLVTWRRLQRCFALCSSVIAHQSVPAPLRALQTKWAVHLRLRSCAPAVAANTSPIRCDHGLSHG